MLDRSNLILKNDKFLKAYKSIRVAEANRKFCNHDIDHLLSVARIMLIRDSEMQEIKTNKDILYALALLHDIGRAKQYEIGIDHNIAGGIVAKSILLECKFDDNEIKLITSAIENHNNLSASSYLAQLLQYADQLSRNCFLCEVRNECNWEEEQKNKGIKI
jgi:uncharacterized protein